MAMTLYDFLKLVKADFDTYDTVFDIEVTVCELYDNDGKLVKKTDLAFELNGKTIFA